MQSRISKGKGEVSHGIGIRLAIVLGANCLVFLVAPAARAQGTTVAEYAFHDGSLASSAGSPDATASNINTGAGLSGDTEFVLFGGSTYTDGASSEDLPLTESAAVTDSDYLSFTVTPTSGSLDYADLTFELCTEVGSVSPPFVDDIDVRSSVDNFTTDLLQTSDFNDSGDAQAGVGGSISLPPESGPVTFNFYFFDNQSSSSTVTFANIFLTAEPVPEPSIPIILGLGFVCLIGVSYRKRRSSQRVRFIPE
ncbi:MAG TPA: PEP-CTERM sorting domain-containing protein [Chthoniobacteraceae bacterium]|jgi:hypothetical protein|nr:PEP-CTERM sorting domain-containing protein [Chthoniobacteraceae bacterium]